MKTISEKKETTQQNHRRKVKRVLERVRRKYNLSGEFTKEDFLRICEGEKVTPVEIELCGKGYFLISKKRNRYIYLKKGHPELLETALHELGHHFMHAKFILKQRNFFKLNPDKLDIAQIEADNFAEGLLGRSFMDVDILTDVLDAEYLEVNQ